MTKVVIWGASGHARVVADIVRLMACHEVVGFLDNIDSFRIGQAFDGGVVLGGEEQLSALRSAGVDYVALGVGDNNARLKLGDIALEAGFKLVTAVHPAATVANNAHLAEGAVLCAGSVVNPCAHVGRLAIINTRASVDHDCEIGEGVHLAPGVCVAGNVRVGRATMLGVGSVVRDGIVIGEQSVIGAGAVVVSDLPDNVTAYGVPAKAMTKRDRGVDS